MAVLTNATVCIFALSHLVTHHTVNRSTTTQVRQFLLFLILMLPVTRMLYQRIRNPDQCLQILETLLVAIIPDLSAIDDHSSGCAITLPKADGAHFSALYHFPFCT